MTSYETKRTFCSRVQRGYAAIALTVMALLITPELARAEQRYLDQVFTGLSVRTAVEFGAGVRDEAPSQPLFMDVYSPSDDTLTNRPVIVLAFPGGFVDGARDNPEMVALASNFARRGYVVASIDYRLIEDSPDNNGELQVAILQAVHDMRAAVRFFREDAANDNQFGTDGKTVFVGGISAGAVMAAITAVLDDGDELPNATLDYLVANGGMAGNSSTNTEFSSRVSGVLQISGAIGQLSWIEPGDPAIYAAHEEFDPVVPCGTLPGIAFLGDGLAPVSSGACVMIPAARAVGVPTELFLVENSLSHVGFSGREFLQILDDSAAFFFNEVLQPRSLVSAVLPGGRSVQVGQPATVFASVINTSGGDATGCSVTPLTPVSAAFSFQLTDASNAPLGDVNTSFAMLAGAAQSLVLRFEPNDEFSPTDVFLEFKCDEGTAALATLGLNSVLLAAASDPVADIIGVTTVVDLVASVGSTTLFAVGSANVGATDEVSVTVDDGGAGLPLQLALCVTDSTTGACTSEVGTSVSLSYEAATTNSLAVFVSPAERIENDPATNRIFVRFSDENGVVRGTTSTAVRSE